MGRPEKKHTLPSLFPSLSSLAPAPRAAMSSSARKVRLARLPSPTGARALQVALGWRQPRRALPVRSPTPAAPPPRPSQSMSDDGVAVRR